MTDQEQLLDLTESYLQSLVSEVANIADTNLDPFAPFLELGIDSFFVLKIIKRLEEDFGSLPKTLLFEHFNINDLAGYFVKKHQSTLIGLLTVKLDSAAAPLPEPEEHGLQQSPQKVVVAQVPAVELVEIESQAAVKPTLMLYQQALEDDYWQPIMAQLFESFKNESSVSRGTRNIAPNVFIGAEQSGYFNYARNGNIILAYGYTGPLDYFQVVGQQLFEYCRANGFELNILADMQVNNIGDVAFSATPFGAVQRVKNLQSFTLGGSTMRRLRYLVQKFEKAGVCRTDEYQCGSNPDIDKDIVRVIDLWCHDRPMVNPLVFVARKEIEAGIFSHDHRIFLTYVDDVLQNVIIVSDMSAQMNGYLMDLEFYGADMPLGGLEYAIVQMIEVMRAEGRDILSLGATFGPKLADSDNADPRVDKILDGLREQNIFNDAGNLQFKNKFRPENKTIFLCRPVEGSDPENVLDIIMMIADPSKNQADGPAGQTPIVPAVSVASQPAPTPTPAKVQSQSINHQAVLVGQARSTILAEHGFNPLNVPDAEVAFDLKTDSWAQLNMPVIDKQMAQLQSKMQQGVNFDESLRGVFPFSYFVTVDAGRTAEHVFNKALGRSGKVLENLLFPTSIFHQIDNDLTPLEIPDKVVFELDSKTLFKGVIDLDKLRQQIAAEPSNIAYVCIEISNNAAGGYPVTIEHLQQVKAVVADYGVPLVIDGTRVVENALFCIEHEPGYQGKDVWSVVHEIYACADVLVVSLAKDFAINKGGLVATNNLALFSRMQAIVDGEGCGLDVLEKKQLALALGARKQIVTRVSKRKQQVQQVWQALHDKGVPVVKPAGGHCILLDVKQLPQFNRFEHPVASFLAWLYLSCGVRGGAHSVGMQKNTSLNTVVRLAIPIGLKSEQVDRLATLLVEGFTNSCNVPELTLSGGSTLGDINANFGLKQYHNVVIEMPLTAPTKSAETTFSSSKTTAQSSTPPATAAAKIEPQVNKSAPLSRDIAVVGMAGRYPDATNLDQLWQNLIDGKDSVTDLPAERLAWRHKHGFSASYRGGFLADVDKFDSLFFNISPREAQMLDPQERLVLETAWEAIEDAGYYPDTLVADDQPRNIGVFVGAVWAMYQMLGVEEKVRGNNVSPNSFLWSIANRISYYMNLSGPSLTLDTACSSSLTALYLGCEAVANNECCGAIVGGVNLDLHQAKWDINSAGGALSPDGLCRAFGVNANGYVAGEGVGVLYLKPLQKAIDDGDNIHGVIKSVVVNHGGKTSGYTVPSPKSQAALIKLAMDKSGIDARTIGYIEAHGTGTELGDPIEINGLSQAFESDNVPAQSCAIGSIKTNVGHLEAAAGVLSITKVLLQMRHQALVPSLHSKALNEFIDFKHSPFYVTQRNQAWLAKEVDGVKYPLRAGVSSFGAGGSNAHVLLEQYQGVAAQNAQPTIPNQQIFPLSARNEAQLREAAKRFYTWLSRDLDAKSEGHSCNDITHTLQIGRKSFDHRVAFIARSKRDLLAKLSSFIDGGRDDDIIIGHVKNADGVTRLFSRKEKRAFIDLLSQRQEPHKLAQLWIDGLLADWQGFATTSSGKRISLPTYPFADRRHWAHEKPSGRLMNRQSGGAIHPMVDANISTFDKQLFKKSFNNQDFFIYDHLVSDVPTLPGVAYLELARKVGELAADRTVRKIRNILWISPIVVYGDKPLEVYVDLKPAGEAVSFEVFSLLDDGQRNPHSQGKLHYTTAAEAAQPDEYIDINAVRSRVNKVIDGEQAYPLFRSLGLQLGGGFQTVQEIYKNDEEILGVLKLPDDHLEDLTQMVLHPGMIDGSLQCAMGAQLGDKLGEMFVPFTIKEVEVIHPIEANCYSYIQEVKNASKPDSNVSRINVFILDQNGKVLVKIKESIGVPLTDVHEKPKADVDEDGFGKLYYANHWQKTPVERHPVAAMADKAVIFFDDDSALYDLHLARSGAESVWVKPGESYAKKGHCYTLNPLNPEHYRQLVGDWIEQGIDFSRICFNWTVSDLTGTMALPPNALSHGVYANLFLAQAMIEQQLKTPHQIVYHYLSKADCPQPHHYALNGFAKSLQHENRKLVLKTLEQQVDASNEAQLDAILNELCGDTVEDMTVRYQNGERSVRRLKKFDLLNTDAKAQAPAYKEQGVYLITGGAGGLGLIFAEFLAKSCNARLVLTGRSELDQAKQAKIDALKALGAQVLYVVADVADFEQTEALLKQVRARFGQLNGIIHSAGVLRDSWLRNKTLEDFQAVCAPKIQGSLNLDGLTTDDKLDFFVLFSSLSAIGGNAGQCDYAYANHYMDGFAVKRELLRQRGERSGKTLSINWSLWADGGMQLDEQTELFFKNNLGIKPLAIDTGTEAMTVGINFDKPYFVVVEGHQEKLETAWGLRKKSAPKPTPQAQPQAQPQAVPVAAAPTVASVVAPSTASLSVANSADLAVLIRDELVKIVMDFLKLERADVSLDTILLDLGFDSIGLASFSNTLNDMYGLEITPVLFFEYPTINDVVSHLAYDHADACSAYYNIAAAPVQALTPTPTPAPTFMPAPALAAPMTMPQGAVITAPVSAPSANTELQFDELQGVVKAQLVKLVMDFLKLDEADVSLDTILLDLGFDSLGLSSFSNTLNDQYGLEITPVLFFEYPTINDVTNCLVTEHAAECANYHGTNHGTGTVASAAPAAASPTMAAVAETPLNFGTKVGFNPQASTAPVAQAAQAAPVGFSMADRFNAKPIAVVGMAGAMPQSADLEAFWHNLKNAVDMITEIPKDRFRWEDFYGDPLREKNKTNSKWGGFMERIDLFDPLFWGISPYEAELMDPQQRIFLESVYQCIEDSGTPVSALSGSNTGLFVGVATNDYTDLLTRHEIPIDAYTSTGNSHAVLVNRISFLLNLHGPSAPLDTACSSSLVATHRAVESLHTGSCDMAIVGGVQAMCSPAAYIAFGQAGMLSNDGKCKTFDEKANGYVRGEGTGAIFLKHLADAQADGNPIYGLIRSTAENHGGRSPSLTAPNPNAQAELLIEAYSKANIDPATVGYIECHGTGTSLGDPIENQALKKAFAKLYKNQNKPMPTTPHIGLGSVKTNIGHLETAAGVAGMLKILLSIQHKQLPATIHFHKINPYILIEDSPFYIIDQTKDWPAPIDAHGNELPRCAGVSSFGFGGANAHIVFEEYPAYAQRAKPEHSGAVLILLSAKNPDRLKDYARRLLDHVDKFDPNLVELAYTLQVGRDQMDQRLAFVAKDKADLTDKLNGYIDGQVKVTGLSQNNVKTNKGVYQPMVEGSAGQQFLQTLLAQRELSKLAEFWVSGVSVDWRNLYSGQYVNRISLPTYPFARERHWRPFDDDAPELVALKLKAQGVIPLHPLVHRNTSTLLEQKFSTRFSGDEFYFTDHKVHADKILPGVAYLEMARVAGELAAGAPVRFIRNLVWLRPIVLGDEDASVEIVLEPNNQGEVSFSVRNADLDKAITHCSGTLAYAGTVTQAQVLDVSSILARCHQQVLSADQLYPFLAESGLNLGSGFQIVQSIHATPYESLAYLQLPKKLKSTAADFWLHPALMDGSLHTAMGMTRQAGLSTPLSLPFSIGEVQVLHTLEDLTYCYATWATQTALANDSFQKVNFELLDSQGRVLVRIKDFISKPVSADTLKMLAGGQQVEAAKLQNLVPIWNALSNGERKQQSDPQSSGILLLSNHLETVNWLQSSCPNANVVELDPQLSIEQMSVLLKDNPFERLVWVAPDVLPSKDDVQTDVDLVAQQQQGVLCVFKMIKALLHDYAAKPLDLTIITGNTQQVTKNQPVNPAHAGIVGLIGSVAKECTQWHMRLLDVDSLSGLTAAECLAMSPDKQGSSLAYRDSQWYVQSLARVEQFGQQQPLYQEGGVYVVIGGAGGLGEVWSRYMMTEHNAKLVWLGRKSIDQGIQDKITALATLGVAPLYIRGDATNVESLQQAFDTISKTYPTINGVVHSAIVLNDQSISQMDEAAFVASLKAKVDVSVNMDKVFGGQKLDFMLFFSSIIAFMKTPGQSNYAAGCTFKDAFAQQLGMRRDYPVKIMNWGFWGNVGIVADESYNKLMEMMGIGSIEPEEGMDALQNLLSTSFDQVALIKTLKDSVGRDLGVTDIVERYQSQGPVLPKATKALVKKISVKQRNVLEGALSTDAMDELVSAILAVSMQSVGLLKDGVNRLEDLKLENPPPAFYQRWVQTSIAHLKRLGWLDDDLQLKIELKPLDALWQDWQDTKSQWETNPNRVATLNLMAACLKAIPAILSGEMSATDAMFPNSSMSLVEGIYKDNILADFFNDVLGDTLVACVKHLLKQDENREIRIVEIGAGTGGTTAKVVPRLKDFNLAEYCYTDLSKAFLMHGEKHYKGDCPSLTTAIFNVTEPLQGQAIEPGRYDLAIATNVLHATPNIRETLRNAKAALKADGVLLLNEISTWQLFSHLTFGLLEGWWLHQDTPVRIPGCPGISPQSWQAVLNAEGYDTVLYPAQNAHHFGQQIIAAASNGVVRQRITAKAQPPVSAVKVKAASSAVTPVASAPVVMPTAASVSAASRQTGDEHVRAIIIANLTDSLKMEASMVNNDASFADYGVDSIVGVNLVRAINENLGIELETIALFEYSTVNSLTNHIVQTWGDKFTAGVSVQTKTASVPPPALVAAPRPMPAPMVRPLVVSQPITNTVSGESHVAKIIVDNLCDALKMEASAINNDASFADFGVDSIVGVNLVRAISEQLDIELETIALFEYSTVNLLTEHIWHSWHDKLAGQLAPASAPVANMAIAATTAAVTMPAAGAPVTSAQAAEPLQFTANVFAKGRFATQHQAAEVLPAVTTGAVQQAGIKPEAIAIIGISGKFSESEDLDSFWHNLKAGNDLVKDITRWPALESSGAANPDKPYCAKGSFIEHIDLFDADFFGLDQSEAVYMDPQQRLFLEEAYKALEDAGYGHKHEPGIDCGIYVGSGISLYEYLIGEHPPAHTFWGNSAAIVPARIAYHLNLSGPAVAIDTACSSALVCIHLACQGLWTQETSMALAGGVYLQPTSGFYQVANRAGMLSPQGKCHSFDAKADGFVPGEGVGVVVLKRLSEALRDGDHVHGVIAASGINQDGSSNGLIAPNPQAQEKLLKSVYQRFDINPREISFLEAHGTGTLLGDSIELGAATKAFRSYTDDQQFCALGTVKTNIGHAAAASGIAGVLKLVYCLKNQQLPPSLHYDTPNPAFNLAKSPFFVNTELKDWSVENGQQRYCAVSSFGFSGTNAHIVLRQAPEQPANNLTAPGYLVVLSGRNEQQLRQRCADMLNFVQQHQSVSLNDLSYTLFVGRSHFAHRFGCVVTGINDLQTKLSQWLNSGSASGCDSAVVPEGNVKQRQALKNYALQCIENCRKQSVTEVTEFCGQLESVMDMYLQGYALDFAGLFDRGSYRISLPVYPFARNSYWVDDEVSVPGSATSSVPAMLHPLLHANTSVLGQQRYTSTFSGKAFFAKALVINHVSCLPASTFVAMATTAVTLAVGAQAGHLQLSDLVWSAPVTLSADLSISVDLWVEGDQLRFEIASSAGVYCQGRAEFVQTSKAEFVAFETLLSHCKDRVLDGQGLYQSLQSFGIDYGAPLQGVERIDCGQNQLLVKLKQPEDSAVSRVDDPLSLILLDTALQATVALFAASDRLPLQPSLPLGLSSLTLFCPCEGPMFARVTRVANGHGDGETLRVNIDLFNEQGRLCCVIKGVSYQLAEVKAVTEVAEQWIFAPSGDGLSMDDNEKMPLFLKQQVASKTGKNIEQIATGINYFELGVTSLGLADMVQQLRELLDEEVSPALLFEYQNIDKFSDYLLTTYPDKLATVAVNKANESGGKAPSKPSPFSWPDLRPFPRAMFSFSGAAKEVSQISAADQKVLDALAIDEGMSEVDYEEVKF